MKKFVCGGPVDDPFGFAVGLGPVWAGAAVRDGPLGEDLGESAPPSLTFLAEVYTMVVL